MWSFLGSTFKELLNLLTTRNDPANMGYIVSLLPTSADFIGRKYTKIIPILFLI